MTWWLTGNKGSVSVTEPVTVTVDSFICTTSSGVG